MRFVGSLGERSNKGRTKGNIMKLRAAFAGTTVLFGLVATVAGSAVAGPATLSSPDSVAKWKLDKRATLSADHQAPGPPSGALATPANGRTGPFPGQVIPGFSGLVDNGDGTFWALPDNGFGAKTNSADFLLRLYHVTPKWETAKGGAGAIEVGRFISLRDPDNKITFPIVNEATPERLLTGADFDIESVVRAPDDTLWIGEEFGPFLLHVDHTGKLLAAPAPFIGGKSPQNPFLAIGETPLVPRSRGFEAMASSANARMLYPIVEGALIDDPEPRRRWIYEFDTKTSGYTGKRWAYRTDADPFVIGDAVMVANHRMMVIERDDFDGPRSVTKKVYAFDLRRTDPEGFVVKELVTDLLYLQNPHHIGDGPPEGGYGMGDPFAFPMQSVESLVLLRDGRLLIANDNNYPGNAARVPGTPDDTEMIVISRRGARVSEDNTNERLVIGHRGASGYRPEHTLAAYELAIRQCADVIEPDLVATRDGVLVARHENEISATTDVALRPEFASRNTTKLIDGVSVTGWFTEDFTIPELKTLRATERIALVRPQNVSYDGLFDVPTFQEVLDLAARYRTCDGQPVGIYPETKHPSYFDGIGLSLEEPLVQALNANGYHDRSDPVFIQSFEVENLKKLATLTKVRLVQLINCSGAPWDFAAAGDPRTYADMVTAAGLDEVASYADGIGVCKNVMIPRDLANNLTAPSPVIALAHARGLVVHGWTFRAENAFLPGNLQSSAVPNEYGNLTAELAAFLDAGMDGFFTDQPDRGVTAVAPYES